MALSLLSKSAEWIPLQVVRPLSGVTLVVPFYHIVSDAHVPHVSNLYRFRTVWEFKADLEFFTKHFTPVTLQDIVDALDGKRALPRSCIHLTFDDGFREMHEIVAPILKAAGVPATFFLPTAFLDGEGLAHYNALSVLLEKCTGESFRDSAVADEVEALLPVSQTGPATIQARILAIGYRQKHLVDRLAEALEVDLNSYVRQFRPHLTSEEVASLVRQGFSIGSHSCDHPLYAELSVAEQIAQTKTSMDLLESRFGAKPRSFAFPHNDDGVTDEFFDAVYSDPTLLAVSFGTSGLTGHRYPRNIERVSMERTRASAARILARQFARATYFRMRTCKP